MTIFKKPYQAKSQTFILEIYQNIGIFKIPGLFLMFKVTDSGKDHCHAMGIAVLY